MRWTTMPAADDDLRRGLPSAGMPPEAALSAWCRRRRAGWPRDRSADTTIPAVLEGRGIAAPVQRPRLHRLAR
jgi:hypothetical protein